MKETVDYIFSHIITIWILMFMLFCGWMGSTLLGVNNYTHEAQEIISRTGGLTERASTELKDLNSHSRFRHISKVTLYQPTKDNKPKEDAPEYRNDKIPYGHTEHYVIWVDTHFLGYKLPLVQSVNSDVRQ